MPKLIIDNQSIDVPEGTKVIEAAEQLGIMIPRFCFHPALGSVGACRVCAVKFLEGPVTGIEMSCMIDAADDMVVSTFDEEVVDFRKHVIELLMLNHPHDCPVCDEGGHCLLQDMTVSGGHGIRRYQGPKRTHHDQYLGPLLQHEMNRCIQCYRCARFYQEFTGYRDLGVMQIGSRVYFGRYQPGILENPFTGNLGDICPTGVFTDKPSRFKGRRWDFERRPALCIHCSLGCHLTVSTRYRDVVRQEARFNPAINGHFICDRGRYGYAYASQDHRPRQARIDQKEAAWQNAWQTAAERLQTVSREAGPAAVACVGSVRNSLETQAALKRLCQAQKWQGPVFWMDQRIAGNAQTAVASLDRKLAAKLRDLENADYILAVGADPVNEAPMLALAMRQARRSGAPITIIDPRPIDLPFDFNHWPVATQSLDLCLARLMQATADADTIQTLAPQIHEFLNAIPAEDRELPVSEDLLNQTAADLRQSQRPVIVCGTEVIPVTVPGRIADYARLLEAVNCRPGLFFLIPGANAFGAALLSDGDVSFDQIIAGIEAGTIRALLVVESDPWRHFPDRQRLERALQQLELLVVLDYLDSQMVANADVFLSTLTLYEAGGLFVNQEGRVQQASDVYRGGRPVSQVSAGNHPPRQFKDHLPGGEAQPAWQALAALAADALPGNRREIKADLLAWLAATQPMFAAITPPDEFPAGGILLQPDPAIVEHLIRNTPAFSPPPAEPGDLELIMVDRIFGTEELSVQSSFLRPLEKVPCVYVSGDDAARLGLSDGDAVTIATDSGSVSVAVAVMANMAPGTLVLPRHHELVWQVLGASKLILRKDQIHKTSGEA